MAEPDVAVPAAVTSAAGGRAVRLVWANEAGGLTFTAGEGDGRCFIKWAPADSGRGRAAGLGPAVSPGAASAGLRR